MNSRLLKSVKIDLKLQRSLIGRSSFTRRCYSSKISRDFLEVQGAVQDERPAFISEKVLTISPEVKEARRNKKPIVALETAIYTHGFPYPDNVALASHLESVVRLNGGVPATIGILHGVARIGLTPEELIELASAAGKKETMKVSRRDLPYIIGLVSPLSILTELAAQSELD
jgi:Indigoidine synthase A like protein